ncbi:hypothetical protein KY290_013012 [Solanum tuberosum]|uniref:MULE transposase domain-containing protein n=1 Tax=Solanum tuberosum TaxID=4113 RepID=A0ABQ7VKJ9_SOLTU|nr:hypothetical protein KY285_012776 [Solanum tuberosum]KAH0769031.1 hypothetical protein KY290_013012 [Solanum tuberosum]
MILDTFVDLATVYTPKDIVKGMLKLHDVSLTYMQAWRAKEKALKILCGDPAESYAKLPGYLYILEQTYPGYVLSLKRKEVVDGVALRGVYGGTMLTASTMDPRGHVLPLAYAIVNSENDASWTWFFK